MSPESQPPRRILSSWKEIAVHFGVTTRTVQLWEAERGLPVHRMPGVKGRVYAYADELAAWTGQTQSAGPAAGLAEQKPRSNLKLWLALTAGVVVTAAAVAWFVAARRDSVPSSYQLEGRSLIVKNGSGETLWRHEFPEVIVPKWESGKSWGPFVETRPWIGDLDADGKHEILFTYWTDPKTHGVSELYCFESDGRIRWRYKPGRQVETRKEQFPLPFFVRMVTVLENAPGKPPILLVVGSHGVFYPSQIAALSAQGKVLRQYWHSGHINELIPADLDEDGKTEIYLVANHNPTKTASLIALDPLDFGGASQESDPDYQILGMGAPRELGRILFPASEYSRRLFDLLNPSGIALQSGRLFLGLAQRSAAPGEADVPSVFYQIGARLELIGLEYSWNFRRAYEDAVRTGRIKPYDLDADLERLKNVTVVTPWKQDEAHTGRRSPGAGSASPVTED